MDATAPPDESVLRRYVRGELPPADAEAVERYLAAHPEAADTLDKLADPDTLADAVRDQSAAPAVDPDLVRRVCEQAAGVEPTAAFPAPAGDTTAAGPVAPTLPPLAPLPGDPEGRLGGYRLVRVLGRGGMGTVYEAIDTRLDRRVALKVMRPELAERDQNRQRFLREGRAAALVEHDHIVPVYHVDEDRGTPFLAMPLLAGETLEDRLTRGPVPLADQLTIARQVAEGLAAAHAAGLIHRDVKPSNIWLETRPGEPGGSSPRFRARLLDFGLARSAREDGHLTGTGTAMGTPAYMAPEQARDSARVDHRADLFSLGGVLYRMATGKPAFAGSDPFTLLTSIATTTPPAAHTVSPAVPRRLSDLIVKLLAKEAKDRPATAADVSRELAAIAADPGQPVRRPRRVRLAVAAAVLLALVGGAAMYGKQVVRVVTNKGELVVTVDDPDVEVVVKQDGVEIRDTAKGRERTYVLTAGDGEVEFRDPASGVVAATKKFRITRGGADAVTVTLQELAASVPRGATTPATLTPDADGDRKVVAWALTACRRVGVQITGEGYREIRDMSELAGKMFTVERLDFDQRKPIELSDLDHLRGLTRLPNLRLSRVPIGDAGVQKLAAMPFARTVGLLELTDAKLTDAGLERLPAFQRVSTLLLHENRGITGRGLAHVKALPALRDLGLQNCDLEDDDLAALAGLNLKNLQLDENRKISAAGLRHLLRMKELRMLKVPGSSTDAWVADLVRNCPDLTDLAIGGKGLTDRSLESVATLRSLTWLAIGEGTFTPNGFAHLRRLDKLTDLRISNNLSPDCFEEIGRLSTLRSLTFEHCTCPDAGLAPIGRMTNPTGLSLHGVSGLTDAGLEHLAASKNLTDINLVHTKKLTAAGVKKLAAALPNCRIASDHGTFGPPAAPVPAGDKPPAKDAYPGELLAYETFDDPKATRLPTITTGPYRSGVRDGRYETFATAGTTGQQFSHDIRPAVPAGAFVTRVRAENADYWVNFRARGDATRDRWLAVEVEHTGAWGVYRYSRHLTDGKWVDAQREPLAQSPGPDPGLAAGKWVTVAARWSDADYEVWLNGKRVGGGPIDHGNDLNSLPDGRAIQIVGQLVWDGRGGFELDHLAVWKQTPAAPPAKDAYPGEVIAYETFDDPKATRLFVGRVPGLRCAVENGLYVMDATDARRGVPFVRTFGRAARDLALVTRVRATPSLAPFVSFMHRRSAARETWLALSVNAAGVWFVKRWDVAVGPGAAKDRRETTPDRAAAADPAAATGQWITLAGRSDGTSYEFWVNGRSVARGKTDDPAGGPAEPASGVKIGADVHADGPARLDIDYAAVWQLPSAAPPAKDAYPGEVIAYETFDDPNAAPPPVEDRPGRWTFLKDGLFVCEEPNAPQDQEAHVRFGPDTPYVTFAARVRATDQEWFVQFRGRAGADRMTWLGFLVKPDGFWRLTRNRAVRVGNEWRPETVLLTEAPAPDPALAAGRWVDLVVRSAGLETEVSANGRRLLAVREPEEVEPGLPPAFGVVAFNTRPGRAGPKPDARFEIDYVAAWRPGLTPEQRQAVHALAKAGVVVNATSKSQPGRTVDADAQTDWDRVTQIHVWARPDRNPLADPAVLAALKAFPPEAWHPTNRWLAVVGRVTDDQFKALLTSPGVGPVRRFRLDDAPLTDAALDGLPRLDPRELEITRCPKVTDAGLALLHRLRGLERVTLKGTGVTAEGVRKLAAALPGCRIESDHGTFGPGAAKLTAEEQGLLDRVNAERAKAGVPPLAADAALTKAARAHADDMARWGKLTHESEDKSPAERVKAAGYAAGAVGENVARVGKDAAAAVGLWLAAEGHTKNLLGKEYAAVGLGVTRDAKGETYVAAVFAAPATK